MLRDYLNQTAEYKHCTGTNDRGQGVYTAPVSVQCRRQKKAQNILDSTTQTIKTQHIYYVEHPVREGDMLDGYIIMAVLEWTGLDGEIIGYKAVM